MILSYFLGLGYPKHLKILIKTFRSCFHVCHYNIRRQKCTKFFKITKKQPKMGRRAAFWAFLASLSNFWMILLHVITCAMMYHDDMAQNYKKITVRGKKCPKSGSTSYFWLFFGYFEKFSALFPSDIVVAFMKT